MGKRTKQTPPKKITWIQLGTGKDTAQGVTREIPMKATRKYH